MRLGMSTVCVALTAVFTGSASAQVSFASAGNAAEVTYAKDVAAIIQNNCMVCHRPGGILPGVWGAPAA